MGLTFHESSAHEKSAGRLRRVPDYNSRPVRMRLFALLAALILVLLVAERARDPRSWQWFFALDQGSAPEKIDNRLRPGARSTAGQSIDTVVIAASDSTRDEASDPDDRPAGASNAESAAAFDRQQAEAVARAWSHGLDALWDALSTQERTLLFRMLQFAQDEQLWPLEERATADALVVRLRERWTVYHAGALESLGDLDEEEQRHWNLVLARINDRFGDQCLSPLETLSAGKVVLPPERNQLAEVLTDLRALCLARVKDDTPFMQPEDNQIWHQLFWELKRTGADELAARSKGEIAYAQLYRQPGSYRGEVVSVRGAARRAYRVRAANNPLGIEHYYVFWLQPFESADTPLVVYAIELPPGFPAVKDRDREGMTQLNEEITLQGLLFKRGAYAGQQGTYNAPLLLARAPQWKPDALALQDAEPEGMRILWQTGLLALAVAVVLAGAVYLTTFRRRRAYQPKDDLAVSATLRSLQDKPVQSPAEALRDLERQAQSAEGKASDA